MTENAYIHIPFCKSKCKYCSFVSICDLDLIEKYVDSLICEIKNSYRNETLKTLYFGGGTPSVLDIKFVEKIISNFNFSNNTEITFEINPDDMTFEYLKRLKELGINRLSFGSQTLNDKILGIIGRRHSSKQIVDSVETAQKIGFDNISLDLIYGLPNQTETLLQEDLSVIKSLGIKHLSTYGLKIEFPSFFYSHLPKNLPNDDTQADMYILINEIMEQYGFQRYEISNFAKKGYESKHNLNYWNNSEYYGFGVAAHGYLGSIRYSNNKNVEKYIQNPLNHASEHFVSPKEKLEEEIFLGFRKSEGINITQINDKFDLDFNYKYKNVLKKYMGKFILPTEIGYKLTIEGILLSNVILADFID